MVMWYVVVYNIPIIEQWPEGVIISRDFNTFFSLKHNFEYKKNPDKCFSAHLLLPGHVHRRKVRGRD